jgi:signal transduction histidine kinase/ActR/RegA family two-component response regulator
MGEDFEGKYYRLKIEFDKVVKEKQNHEKQISQLETELTNYHNNTFSIPCPRELNMLLNHISYYFLLFNTSDFSIEYQTDISDLHKKLMKHSEMLDIQKYMSGINEVTRFRHTVSDEIIFFDTDNQPIHFAAKFFPVNIKDNHVLKVGLLLKDITFDNNEKSKANNTIRYLQDLVKKRTFELTVAESQANEADKLKTAFLTNLSHELRTPMNAIVGFANLLGDDNLDTDEKTTYIKYINENVDSLLTLINDILDTAKIEAGEISLEIKDFYLHKLLVELYQSFYAFKHKQRKDSLNFRLCLPAGVDELLIHSDPNKIQQILSNLLKNAIKFTESGSVEFGYHINQDNYLEFFVRDTGIGINKFKQDIIFDRFRKIEDNEQKLYGGAGVGLTISKKMVEMLGGRIWLNSEPLQGTTFYFSIPYQPLFQQPLNFLKKQNNYQWIDKQILLVDDKENTFVYFKEVFEDTGAKIHWAKNGAEAIEECKKNKGYDLILMDLCMPGMDGYKTKQEIKRILKHTPIIAQSSFSLIRDRENIINHGFDDFIPKFLSGDDILNTVCKYFSHVRN